MANWTILKNAIANVIKTNGNQEITGQVLQNTLTNIINVVGENATFVDVATPSTNPGTPYGPVFYLAAGPGVFSNFGITLSISECAVFLWNGVSWIKKTISFSLEAFKHITSTGIYNLPGYISTIGSFVASESYKSTDFIPLIKKHSGIIIENIKVGPSSLAIAFYDEHKVFISGINDTTFVNISVEDIPENAKYIRCGTLVYDGKNAILYVNNIVALGIQVGELGIQVNRLETHVPKLVNFSPTLDFAGYYTLKGYLTNTPNARNTGFIPIAGYKKLEFRVYAGKESAAVSFWNKDREYIPSLSIPDAESINSLSIPDAESINSGTLDLTRAINSGTIDLTQSKYDDAEYVVISYSDPSGLFPLYICKLTNENSLESRVDELESKAIKEKQETEKHFSAIEETVTGVKGSVDELKKMMSDFIKKMS